MVGSAGHNFVNWDGGGGSDTEKLENIDEHDLSENGLLLHYDDDSHHVVNNDLNVMIPSVEEGISVEPYIGMMFPSLEDARDFYYEYAKRTGFTIRTNRIRHSVKNMAVIGRDFVCSREGFRAAKHTLRKDRVLPPRPITREGCKAMIRLAARDGSKWVVTKFVKDHNHKLMAHCKFPGDLPTVNILSEEEKDEKIRDLYDEIEQERKRSAAVRQQLHVVLKDVEEHTEFMSIRVEDIVNKLKDIELDGV